MQEHLTKVELYGKLTTLPHGETRWKGAELHVKRSTRADGQRIKSLILYDVNNKILLKMDVLDYTGDNTELLINGKVKHDGTTKE